MDLQNYMFITMFHKWKKLLDKREYTSAFFMVISKTIDILNYELLADGRGSVDGLMNFQRML